MRHASGTTAGLIISARGAAALLALLYLAQGTAQTPAPALCADQTEAQIATPEQQRVTVILTPRREAVLSAMVSARVKTVNRELGQGFERDDVLVQLDDLEFRVNEQLAEAELEAAEGELVQVQRLSDEHTRQRHADAVLKAAQAALTATEQLHASKQASQLELENARRDVTTAEAECALVAAAAAKELIQARRKCAVARGQLELAREELAACTIAAPHPGRVARVLVNEHELVDRGTPVIEIVDDRVLRARFLLPSALFRSVTIGQELEIVVRETQTTASATISHIAAVLDAASTTFEVYAEIDNRDGELRAGMNGWLNLASIRRN
jgi:multidrug resistance efflux pump